MELRSQVIGGGGVGRHIWQKECLWEILISTLNRNLTYSVKWWDENLTDAILRKNGWRGSVWGESMGSFAVKGMSKKRQSWRGFLVCNV